MDKRDVIKEDLEEIAQEISGISSQLEGKRVLLAGGAGFLGKYLVASFDHLNKNYLKNPCEIFVYDNFITGLKENVGENPNIHLIQQDITKPFQVPGKLDYILHAASLASPVFYDKHKLETLDVGYMGVRNLLEIAKEKRPERFMFFSSSEVYGNPLPENIPTPEDYFGNVSCNGARSCYDEAKRVGEALCVTYADSFDIPIRIVRPFNVYGPGMRLDDGRVLPNFTVAAMQGKEIPLYRGGTQTRTFCYIADATVGWFKALLYPGNKKEERVFNIGNDDQEIKMKHFAELVLGLVGNKNSKIKYIKDTKSAVYHDKVDPDRRCPDLTKSRNTLEYNPKVNLVDGVKRFITWAEQEIEEQGKIDLEKIV